MATGSVVEFVPLDEPSAATTHLAVVAATVPPDALRVTGVASPFSITSPPDGIAVTRAVLAPVSPEGEAPAAMASATAESAPAEAVAAAAGASSAAAPVSPATEAPVAAETPSPTTPEATVQVETPTPAPEPEPASSFYLPEAAWGGPSAAEQLLLDGVNAARAEAGLAPYAWDSGLAHIGRIRSRQMADQGYFGHRDPYGYQMYTELLAYFGYGYAWAGENIARNNYGAGEAPSRALVSLMNSSTHRANILDSDFTRIGIGEYTTADGMHYYTMVFLS